ncbi:MAG: response regulator [Archangiaceae bacterium]|nr:response regulator [Archangiaceae bacterium]
MTARPPDEALRLDRLSRLSLLGTAAEDRFDHLTRLAALTLKAEIAAITLVGDETAWLKSAFGTPQRWVPRTSTICSQTVMERGVHEVSDVPADGRFASSGVTGAYLGVPLGGSSDASALGALCVVTAAPRRFTPHDYAVMSELGRLAEALLFEAPATELNHHLQQRIATEAVARAELEHSNRRLGVLGGIAALGLSTPDVDARTPFDLIEQALGLVSRLAPEVRVSWSSLERDGRYTTLASHGPASMKTTTGLTGTVALAPDHLAQLLAGRPVVTTDLFASIATQGLAGDWGAIDVRASVEFAVPAAGGSFWLMCLDSATAREWDRGFVDVIEEVARQLALVLRATLAHAEEQKAMARLVTVLASQDSGVLVENERREVVLLNAAFLNVIELGGTPADYVGKDVKAVFREPARRLASSAFIERVDELLAHGARVTGEIVRLPDGRVFERDFVPVTLAGRAAGTLWQYRDVTRRIRELEQLEQARNAALEANLAKSAFLATISHEIRTPLNGVLGTLSLLLEQLDPRHHGLVRTAADSADVLLRLLTDVLDASKLEAGKLAITNAPFGPGEALGRVVALFEPKAREKGLTLELTQAPSFPPQVMGDVHRFEQIVGNLVSNAIKFTDAGRVLVSAGTQGSALLVSVHDTGPGIPSALYGRLFEKFRQGDESRTRRHGGSGLGLAISADLASLMGGQLRHVPTATGARFDVELPLPRAVPQTTPTPVPAARLFPGVKVLVVDDNAVNRLVAVSHLKKLGCSVEEAVDGADALDRAHDTDFHLIFMDCHMPGVDGFEATRRLRQQKGASLPIIALTASALEEDVKLCTASGMDGVLTKPVKRADFVTVLERFVR